MVMKNTVFEPGMSGTTSYEEFCNTLIITNTVTVRNFEFILWQEDPLLGNDREINKYTTLVTK
jgi:hypothetical protein